MERNYSAKGSFTGRGSYKKKDSPSTNEDSDTTNNHNSSDNEHADHEQDHDHDHNQLDQVSQDVDQFTRTLTTVHDKSSPPHVPDSVEKFAKVIEARITKYYSGDVGKRSRKMKEEDSFFIEAVNRMSKLTNAFREYPSNSSTSSSLNRTSMVLQRAMSLLEEEFRAVLEDSRTNHSNSKSLSGKNSSFNAKHDEHSDRSSMSDSESNRDEDFPSYPPEVVAQMTKIAMAMVSAGYETECCQVYTIARRNAFEEQMKKLEFEKLNIEDVQKMHWEPLEGEVARWIRIVKKCSTVLFPGECKLGEAVFADHPMIHRSLFGNLARAVVIQLLDFAEAIAMTKRSAEKLFKFLDMYETLRELVPAVVPSPSADDCEHELKSEIQAANDRIGEAVVNIFCDLENSIKSDVAKTPVPGGAVHPLTRYVMNYLKHACEYKDTLEQIFQQHAKLEKIAMTNRSDAENEKESPDFDPTNLSPVSAQLLAVMDLLDSNLEAKSRLYKDLSLRYIFLMNNGRYILQKVKGSAEIHQLMGNTWCRKRSTEVRQFHKNYQRETWGRLLQCLGHEGLQVNGKVQKTVLKERFKNFNTMFDEIHKTQSTWVVSDEQLLSELRVSVSAVVIPAYRSFVGRFSQYFDGGRQTEKYIKYQPDDIETLIEGLFDGNPTSMGRRR